MMFILLFLSITVTMDTKPSILKLEHSAIIEAMRDRIEQDPYKAQKRM